MALIQARQLSKSFSGKAAVRGLSFDVVPGSVTGFLGPNGAGKSTTMRLMLGLDNGEGLTTYDGVSYRDLKEPLRHVGSVLDAKPFHPTRRAIDHLRMLAVSNNIPMTRVTDVINLVGLGDVARARPKTFSLGMGQRLGAGHGPARRPRHPDPRRTRQRFGPSGRALVAQHAQDAGLAGAVDLRLQSPALGDGPDGRSPRRDRPRFPDRQRRDGRLHLDQQPQRRRHPCRQRRADDSRAPGQECGRGRRAGRQARDHRDGLRRRRWTGPRARRTSLRAQQPSGDPRGGVSRRHRCVRGVPRVDGLRARVRTSLRWSDGRAAGVRTSRRATGNSQAMGSSRATARRLRQQGYGPPPGQGYGPPPGQGYGQPPVHGYGPPPGHGGPPPPHDPNAPRDDRPQNGDDR